MPTTDQEAAEDFDRPRTRTTTERLPMSKTTTTTTTATATATTDDRAARLARVDMHVPQSARDNYLETLKRSAVAGRTTLAAAQADQVAAWRAQAEVDPTAGTGVLADWLEDADLSTALLVDDAAAAAHEIAMVNAKADPRHYGGVTLTDADRAEVADYTRAMAARSTAMSPVVTDDGAVVPASDVDGVLAGDIDVPVGPTVVPSGPADDVPAADTSWTTTP